MANRKCHFEIIVNTLGDYAWRFRAQNGKILADGSEGYRRLSDCKRGINLLKKMAATAAVLDKTNEDS